MQNPHWHKSSYSGDSSNCVEITATQTIVHIRDSKNTEGPHLVFPITVWSRFISHTPSPASSALDLI
ncbi:DUF397 domain-containing protein [Streptomyces canus]|uniref:DUF397 domain-containing protein n=1 Tax=Streptomyces canus TaxID=58343 RepID=UPI00371E91DE